MSDEHPATYRIEVDAPLEKGRRAVRAYDGDTLVLDGVLEPRRPQATLPAGVCNWTSPAGFERGVEARAQIEAEANRHSTSAPGIHQATIHQATMEAIRERIRELAESDDHRDRNYLVHTLRSQAELWRRLRDQCQEQGHDDAGHEYEELAEDCMRAVVAWQGGDQ